MNARMCCLSAPLAAALAVSLLASGCTDRQQSSSDGGPKPQVKTETHGSYYQIDLPKAETRSGTAVAILVDTSGSMARPVPDLSGQQRPKNLIAREALQRVIEHTAKWKKDNPNSTLQVGIYNFASDVAEVLPMGDFDEAKAQKALGRIPGPNGGTAIGRAIEEAAKALYRSGCTRKFLICITDGENTSGPAPDRVARQLFAQTEGAVAMDFVAFNTSAKQFAFVKDVKGSAVEASNGALLEKELNQIYRKKVLAEAPDSP
jgi:hypothetical protein